MKCDTPIAKMSPENGFEWFFKEHYQPLVWYCYKMVKDIDTAEDFAEETFILFHELKVIEKWLHLNDIELKKVCRRWLYVVSRNSCLNYVAREKRREEKIEEIADVYPDWENALFSNIIRSEVSRLMKLAIEELPSECKKVFYGLYVQGMSVRQFAELYNLSISTIKNQKGRGLGILRSLVDEDGVTKNRKVKIGRPLKTSKENRVNWAKIAEWANNKCKRKKNNDTVIDYDEILKMRSEMLPKEMAEKLSISVRLVYKRIWAAKKRIVAA